MRKIVLLVACASAITVSCNKKNASCGETTPSFSNEVNPIISQKCVSCHGATKAEGSIALNSYEAIYSNRGEVQHIISSDHEGVSLSSSEKTAITCWIDGDAPNN